MMFLTDNLSSEQIDSLGKKAGNLVELIRAGVRVPGGFILRYQDTFTDDDLLKAIEKIGGFPVAVRSSGQLEDLGDMSFAGLYETFLYVDTLEKLKESIHNCFQSSQGERVRDYLSRGGITKTNEELYSQFSVLVQKMIDPFCAGVAFSVNPLDGIEDHMLLEVCEGVGEHLVSGEVTPNQYVYHYFNKEIISKNIENEKVNLSLDQLEELSSVLLDIQGYFKIPQDVEWAIDKDGVLWLLQARPITTIEWRKDLGELTNADLKDGGISSAVCTPLMFSLYRMGMNESMPGYFRKLTLLPSDYPKHWLFACYGRAYWSAGEVKKMLKKIPGYNESSFDEDLGIMKNYGEAGPDTTGLNPLTLLRAIPVLIGMEKEFKNCHKENSQFADFFEPLEKNYHEMIKKGLGQLSDEDFRNEFLFVMKTLFLHTETSYYRTIYNNSNLQTMFKEFLEKIEKKTGQKINTIQLLTGLDGVSHLDIQNDLKLVKDSIDRSGEDSDNVKESVVVFLKKHFHHGDRELDITVPRWGEVPERVIEMARDYVESPMGSSASYEVELNKIKCDLRSKGGLFVSSTIKKVESKLDFVRSYLKLREKMREYSTRSYFIVRQFILEQDRRWGNSGDIFFLHIDEILKLIESDESLSDYKKAISYRRKLYDGFTNFESPNDFGFGRRQSELTIEEVDGKTVYRGIACSPGLIKGRVIVARTLEETADIKDGDILITKFTDPGWTPVLGKVTGVVTEVGGVLSHAAVISREYGIPAVLNVSKITSLLQTGMTITLDGDAGAIIVESE
jgi:phosphoenolpyruvate synthase/pyruvate phosphate dikinase